MPPPPLPFSVLHPRGTHVRQILACKLSSPSCYRPPPETFLFPQPLSTSRPCANLPPNSAFVSQCEPNTRVPVPPPFAFEPSPFLTQTMPKSLKLDLAPPKRVRPHPTSRFPQNSSAVLSYFAWARYFPRVHTQPPTFNLSPSCSDCCSFPPPLSYVGKIRLISRTMLKLSHPTSQPIAFRTFVPFSHFPFAPVLEGLSFTPSPIRLPLFPPFNFPHVNILQQSQ